MTSLPLAILFTVLAFASCAPVPLPRDNPKGFGTAKHVLVIGCDGFGEFLKLIESQLEARAGLVQVMFFGAFYMSALVMIQRLLP